MKIYVVLLNWNGFRDTLECLASLFKSNKILFSVIVCDNGSSDDSVAEITQWASATLPANEFATYTKVQVATGARLDISTRLALVENGANLGFAGGNNVGVRLALNSPECGYVWLLNNDTTVDANALSNVLARAESDPRIGLCGSTLIYHHDQQMVQALGGATFNRYTGRSKHIGAFLPRSDVPTDPAPTEAAMDYVVGAAMLVRRAYLEQVGLMQEDYFLYYEEIDWCTRGNGLFSLGYAANSFVFHKEGASIGTASSGGSTLSIYYLFRNRVRFTLRFFPLALPFVLASCGLDIFKFMLKHKGSSAAAAIRGVLQLKRRKTIPGASI